MMQLLVNGEPHQVPEATSVQDLLNQLGYEPKAIAVAVDGDFVPKHQYATLALRPAQSVEVLSPMQGG
ncbi:sulfur carrier protein ThiS [Vampirovibrio chlorellavorus]|uniref:sulfur carrier protein ThiS n=1 Tax=Vampirovibrio chlorellavorus TaxID=758823 RepID=UPI0026EC9091|nr:sulfur carrier protein ThiS [Vampirovibrio chlorellavorus]